uniref:EF-hand domain-containing protein n=1 Tax=Haptolina brevifila TaxID=156173 RepID=A0A7S2GTC3_9EUKA|mmetsp:Transcript_45164/g.90204  ORF Transcript_45164/g.90204 Transcript_45164/m.90204 type:complete len:497 (+) Transcript_45164:46-1536(+)
MDASYMPEAAPSRTPAEIAAEHSRAMAEESAAHSAELLFEQLFPLFDRDGSGFADHADVTAALQCAVHTPEEAARVLARVSESGHLDQRRLRELLESCMPPLPHWPGPPAAVHVRDVTSRHVRLVKFVLAIVRNFERRETERGGFVAAAQARDISRRIREAEQQRAFQMLESRKSIQRSTLRKGQANEAHEFNEAWTGRMGEFNKHAKRAVEALRAQHEAAVQELLDTQRPQLLAHFKQHNRSKEALDAQKVIERLSVTGNYAEAVQREKRLEELVRRDAADAESLAEVELQKRLSVLQWQQKLEVRALMTKIERIRSEHRGQWEDGLSKLVLSQRTMLTELNSRQHRETRQTATAVRSMLQPSSLPADRQATPLHSNLALLSPRASTPRDPSPRGEQPQRPSNRQAALTAPIVLQRPSRMQKASPAAIVAMAATGSLHSPRCLPSADASGLGPLPSPTATYPPRPFTSEHVPLRSSRGSKLTPRPLTTATTGRGR